MKGSTRKNSAALRRWLRPVRHFLLLLPAAFVLIATGAAPNGGAIAHNGNGHGALACTTCHGANFQGNAAIRAPALAGLPQTTILAKLAHYAGPTGHNAMMRQIATSLSPAERLAVAGYLSSLAAAQ
jgi:thiosulfate dehydrogenase